MEYEVINATTADLTAIYQLFEEAILFQQQNNYTGWDSYDKAFIQADIRNGLLYKIIHQEDLICIFSICFTDPVIWRDKEIGDAIYLHRLVLNRQFKGAKAFQLVLDWTKLFAQKSQLKYIRMDTWASNQKIIDYYKSYGFTFIENYTTANTNDLPLQHRNLHVALLELKI